MAGLRIDSGCCRGLLLAVPLGLLALGGSPACRQTPPSVGPPGYALSSVVPEPQEARPRLVPQHGLVARGQTPSDAMPPTAAAPSRPPSEAAPEPQVVEVRIVGARRTPKAEIRRQIRTRAGRPFDPELIEEDVRRLNRTRKFVRVKAHYLGERGGRVVIFEVLERSVVEHVKYVGNQKIPKKTLAKESEIKVGDALDPFMIEDGRRRLERFYRSKGFTKAQITVIEGSQTGDRGVIYLINEGPKPRILWTSFVGNTIANDAKLRTKIQSKPGFLWIFKGEVDRQRIDEDRQKLIDYYRSLGYFRARVGHPLLDYDDSRNWLRLTFVIDEGPRYQVRRISFVGNTKFTSEELAARLKLKAGEPFNQIDMQTDQAAIADEYGAVGYYFADVQPDMRFREEPGQLDVVYRIQEGQRCYVGRIDPKILGDYPHTRITTILNRLSLRPGDVLDTREKQASERRLEFSGLFEVDRMRGIAPQIVVHPPDLEDMETGIARQPGGPPPYRGQSPDPVPHAAYLPPATAQDGSQSRVGDSTVSGRRIGEPQPQRRPSAGAPRTDWPPSAPERPVIRGQSYSADAGQSVPSLRRPGSWLDAELSQSNSDLRPPVRYDPPAAQATLEAPTQSEQSPWATYPEVGTPPPTSPAYGSQFGPVSQGPWPAGGRGPGLFSPNQPTIDDALSLFGRPPAEDPPLYVDVSPEVYETRTGRLMLMAGINSDAGLLGSVIVDQQNFDWTRFPRSWADIRDNTAWTGAGQRFRFEAVPGTHLHKYTVSFQEPYWFDSQVSLGLAGYFYNRRYREWEEERVGGRIALGYQFTHDLSGTFSFRGSKVQIFDPIVPTPDELTEVLGENGLYGFRLQLAHDTRDHQFLATQGHLVEMGVEHVTGSFHYTRGDVDLRKYILLRQHPDRSGRHVLGLNARAAITGSQTPIYDHYYIGGFSTLRGFDFRGASPRDPATGVTVGGHFMLLASAEYMFPLTADENLRAVVFCDTGTVEPSIDNWTDNYRVAPGFGLRILIPGMGGAPIALDFAFPISDEPGDDDQIFSFFIGLFK